jgi:hypothetical protein
MHPFGRRLLASMLMSLHTNIGCRRYCSSLRSMEWRISLRIDIQASSLILIFGAGGGQGIWTIPSS